MLLAHDVPATLLLVELLLMLLALALLQVFVFLKLFRFAILYLLSPLLIHLARLLQVLFYAPEVFQLL